MIQASLCTGLGACELAAIWVGWQNAFSCEIDKFCRHILKFYYPKSKHYGNIYETDFSEWKGKIDVLTAGFPCQPFSVAGSRQGAEDDRYLWPEVLRGVDEIRPTWFIGENVAGIKSMVLPGDEIEVGSYTDIFGESYQETEMRQQFIVDRICNDLESIGYSVQPIIIPACAVGAPHRRDRIWFIAHTTSTGLQEWFSFDRREDEKKTEARVDYELKRYGKKRITTNPECFGDDKIHKKIQSDKSDGVWIDRISNQRYVANTNKFNDNLSGFFTGQLSQQQPAEIFRNIPDWENFPTQSPVCSGNDGFPVELSGITVSKWITESTKALGNSMVPQVVYQIFKRIEEIEKQSNL